jgi:SAM-dependent methyltransferase
MSSNARAENAIDYDHSRNLHRIEDSRIALRIVFPDRLPESILDVGCGAGTWLRNIAAAGVTDYIGVDGVDIPEAQMLFDRSHFVRQNLGTQWDLGRRFEAALCLEVAEHLEEEFAETLIDGLVRHSDWIVFSAACPGQPGQHHVNCQWPAYWQGLFNARGYTCDDALRWRLWDVPGVDPWYKQNMFIARRSAEAGREPRMRAVVHPEMIPCIGGDIATKVSAARTGEIAQGDMPAAWYLWTLVSAFAAKLRRKLESKPK